MQPRWSWPALQDPVTELVAEPWPHRPGSGYVFHDPTAVVEGGEIRFWYGSESDPVLAFEPIPLAELT